MLLRRHVARLAFAGAFGGVFSRSSNGQQLSPKFDAFDAQLLNTIAVPDIVEATHAYRELDQRLHGPSNKDLAAQPHLGKIFSSSKPISDRAKQLLIIFEVTGEELYNARYQHPVWPKGRSGLTLGVGYDLGYVDANTFARDWAAYIAPQDLVRLESACNISGPGAQSLAPQFQDISIPWSKARSQFDFALLAVAGETEYTFPNSSSLSGDSFGALVSLVYNRGGSLEQLPDDPLDRRKEMRLIRQLVVTKRFDAVSDQIMSMTRLWKDDPNAAGLIRRRQLEAALFRAGLS